MTRPAKPVIEQHLRDVDGSFSRYLYHTDVTEFQVLALTQRELRNNPNFKAYEAAYLRKYPVPESTSDWIKPNTPDYDTMMASRKAAFYVWMAEMGATESEVSSSQWDAFAVESFKPGGHLATIIHMASPFSAASQGRINTAARQQAQADARRNHPMNDTRVTPNQYSANGINPIHEPPIDGKPPQFNPKAPGVFPTPDGLPKQQMPNLSSNGYGGAYGSTRNIAASGAKHIRRNVKDVDAWRHAEQHLGSGTQIAINPFTGEYDANRIFVQQTDGTWNSVRMGSHEMRNPKDFHVHLEQWNVSGNLVHPDQSVHITPTKKGK